MFYLKTYHLVLVCFLCSLVNSTSVKSSIGKDITPKKLNNDESHEDIHSKNSSSSNISEPVDTSKLTDLKVTPEVHKTVKKVLINTNKTQFLNKTAVSKEVFTEGGPIPNSDIKVKTVHDNNNKSSNLPPTTKSLQSIIANATYNLVNKTSLSPLLENVPTAPKLKKAHHVSPFPENISSARPSSSNTTTKLRKKKPLFSLVPNEDVNEGDSFIESSTTGRDYVLPIVLFILALPLIGCIIKIIYRRGTEFTERQQYHRMYLIDGMYNSRG